MTTTEEPVELPDYHGRKPSGMRSRVSGYWTRVGRLHTIDERVVAVVELSLKADGHAKAGDQIVYVESFAIEDGFEVVGDAGKRLLSTLRTAYRTADDGANGKARLPLEDLDPAGALPIGVTDADGVALTDAELADIRNDPLRAVADERLTPVVVVFSDGARQLWPDEFDPDEPRPSAGDTYEDDGSPYVYVAELLDAVTGETVAEWTEAQESERLLALEHAAEERESARPLSPLAYYRLEFRDGSVAEVDPDDTVGPGGMTADVARAVRVIGVASDGTETVVRDDTEDIAELEDGDEEDGIVIGVGDELPPLPGEDDNVVPFGFLHPDAYYRRMKVGDLAAYIADVDDLDLLERIRDIEANGQQRPRALAALDGRITALSAP